MALVAAAGIQTAASHVSVKRIDDPRITAGDIDATVERLMNAAHMTGVGACTLQ